MKDFLKLALAIILLLGTVTLATLMFTEVAVLILYTLAFVVVVIGGLIIAIILGPHTWPRAIAALAVVLLMVTLAVWLAIHAPAYIDTLTRLIQPYAFR